jgi:hypothetical protein
MSSPTTAVVAMTLALGYNLSGELPVYLYLNYDDNHLVT